MSPLYSLCRSSPPLDVDHHLISHSDSDRVWEYQGREYGRGQSLSINRWGYMRKVRSKEWKPENSLKRIRLHVMKLCRLTYKIYTGRTSRRTPKRLIIGNASHNTSAPSYKEIVDRNHVVLCDIWWWLLDTKFVLKKKLRPMHFHCGR